MKSLSTFRYGGTNIDRYKNAGPGGPIGSAFLPTSALVFLKQHRGPEARCLVKQGDHVREGMLIGKAEGAGSVNVHAPIPGRVRELRQVSLPGGGETQAVLIDLKGSFDHLGKRGESYLWTSMMRRDLLAGIMERGVVMTQEPGLSLFELLSSRVKTELLILNAVESEPYVRTETLLFSEKQNEVLAGFGIVKKILEPQRSLLALAPDTEYRVSDKPEDKKHRQEIVRMELRYPQDITAQLIDAIYKAGRSPPESAVLVLRPSTLLAVYEAIVHARPMIETYVSLAGGALKRPALLKARLGTPISALIEECGGLQCPPARLVLGGAFRGIAFYDLSMPITKSCSSILVLSREETGGGRRFACIRCGRCAEVCPERLEPELLYRFIEKGRVEQSRQFGLERCSLCGLCAHVCPSRVPLLAAFAEKLHRSAEYAETSGGSL